jgi:membrane-associated protease RseP (regulator of RpoE activity)
VNLLLGLGLIYAYSVVQGEPRPDLWTVDSLSTAEDVQRYDQDIPANAALAAAFADGESPADLAGLQVGDRIVEVDGEQVDSFDAAGEVIQARPGEQVDLVLVRDGERIETSTTLGTLSDGEVEVGFLGFGPAPTVYQSLNPVEAVPETFATFGEMVTQSASSFARVFTPEGISNVVDNAATSTDEEPADAPAPIPGSAHPNEERVVSIFGATYLGAQLAEESLTALLLFLGFLNIFLGVVNLVPLLPFDGGHAVVATYEKVREKQLHQRRYLADVGKLLPLTYGVFLVLSVLAVLTIFPDIVNPPQL